MKPVTDYISSKIYANGRGWIFSASDFVENFNIASIEKSLSLLTRKQTIRRIYRGLYYYPRFSKMLDIELSPDIDQIAAALARKFNWRIEPSGETSLNLLGLSTQIPGRYVYLSDGPNKQFSFGKIAIEFKKAALKDIGFKYKESRLIVAALKSLGKEHVNDEIIEKIRMKTDSKMNQKIIKDTKTTTGWIYEAIKKIYRMD